ncbi:hypothetical protein DRN86_05630 [Candidatus Geothermarchaeota archaeon]|nr:MAG: hypothetical protein DRN86_05630 [Candidatus Geothermarchaeota archaeon]
MLWGRWMMKCDVEGCDEKAAYTITDSNNGERHLCEKHFMEFLKKIPTCRVAVPGTCETCG